VSVGSSEWHHSASKRYSRTDIVICLVLGAFSFSTMTVSNAFAGRPTIGIVTMFLRYWLLVRMNCIIGCVPITFARMEGTNLLSWEVSSAVDV